MREKKRVDDDWKKRAAEEKAKLGAAEAAARGGAPGGTTPGAAPPPADSDPTASGATADNETETDQVYIRLISTLGGQAMMALGLAEDPHTGQRFLDFDLARQTIDMLGSLEKKSRGNLSREEDALLGDVLHQLRLAYTQTVQQAQAAAMESPPPGAGPAGPGE